MFYRRYKNFLFWVVMVVFVRLLKLLKGVTFDLTFLASLVEIYLFLNILIARDRILFFFFGVVTGYCFFTNFCNTHHKE